MTRATLGLAAAALMALAGCRSTEGVGGGGGDGGPVAARSPVDSEWEIVRRDGDVEVPDPAAKPENLRGGEARMGESHAYARPRPGDPRFHLRKTFDCGSGGACTVNVILYFAAGDNHSTVDGEKFRLRLSAGGRTRSIEVDRVHQFPGLPVRVDACGRTTLEAEFTDAGSTPGIQSEVTLIKIASYGCR